MKSTSPIAAFALAAIFCFSTSVHAAPSAEDAIKYRNLVMDSMAAHYGALMLLLFDKVDVKDTTQNHADALANASAEIDQLFPEISRDGETEALPVIWKDSGAFSKQVKKAQAAATDLQAAIAGGDRKATLSAAAAVGKSCKGCHESYRAEHEHDDSD